jgi:tRNA(Ile)-lysidine synthase
LRIVERTLREECHLLAGDCLLLAVSGGGDSIAMLHVMARLAPSLGVGLFAHGVDHGLRAEASRELDLAGALATELGIEFTRSEISVALGGNLQARARVARYAELEARAQAIGGAIIATAHHAEDRAETVILRLLRGTGLVGLGVLAPREGQLLRPMVRARRADILLHLARHELRYATDPSNENPRFLRVRVRNEILPLLAERSPSIVGHLCAIADDACQARDGDHLAVEPLGRRQRSALARAIEHRQLGFELPVGNGMVIRLGGDKPHG